MERFGVDKPDLRFGMELVELTDVFASTEFKAFSGAAAIKAVCVPADNTVVDISSFGRNQLDRLTERAKKLGAKGLVWLKVTEEGIESPVAKFLSETETAEVLSRTGAQAGDLVLIVADNWMTTCEVLGQIA
jgi:aspartyl-tRNA synthetase